MHLEPLKDNRRRYNDYAQAHPFHCAQSVAHVASSSRSIHLLSSRPVRGQSPPLGHVVCPYVTGSLAHNDVIQFSLGYVVYALTVAPILYLSI
jgi:hypothetical protein